MKTSIFSPKKYIILLAISVIGLTLLDSCKKDIEPDTIEEFASAKGGGSGGGGGITVRSPLKIPATVITSNFTINAAPGTTDLTPSISGLDYTAVWQYDNSFPGRTIVASKGDNMTITYQNNLPEESIIHWHGMLVDHRNDGGPMMAIPAGQTFTYQFPILNRAALNWYHPHPHMATGKQVYNGLAGAFIIRDPEENALNLPSGNYEVPLVFRDITLDKKGNPVYNPTGGGYFGKVPLVNGTKDPYLSVDRTVYRFRVLIGSTTRLFRLALSNGAPFILIGNDGGLLPNSSPQTSIEVSPGERLDLMVDFRTYNPGEKIMLKELNSGWDLLEFRVASQEYNYTGAM
jgi:FtsP/CotA-like multicopper oxidase with cupredoxin domain